MQLITGAMISVLLVLQVTTIGRATPVDPVVYRCEHFTLIHRLH